MRYNLVVLEVETDEEPENIYYVSYKTKKRNAIPLVDTTSGVKRITDVSNHVVKIYVDLDDFEDSKYAYVAGIEKL